MKRAALLLLLAGCASGPVRRVRFEKGIDQTQKSVGCYVFLPDSGEVTLLTPETCALVVEPTR